MKQIMIHAENGLHMRPIAQLVEITKKFAGDVLISKNNLVVNGKSAMKILSLGIMKGDVILIEAKGEGGEKIEEDIVAFLKTVTI